MKRTKIATIRGIPIYHGVARGIYGSTENPMYIIGPLGRGINHYWLKGASDSADGFTKDVYRNEHKLWPDPPWPMEDFQACVDFSLAHYNLQS